VYVFYFSIKMFDVINLYNFHLQGGYRHKGTPKYVEHFTILPAFFDGGDCPR